MRLFSVFIFIYIFYSCKQTNHSKSIQDSVIKKVEFNPRIGNITDFNTITFPSKDGLLITADLYLIKKPKSFILLSHQAGLSRGEYISTAKTLNKMGYSCMAIDQRSGKIANNIINETAKRALEKGLKTDYLSAKPDILAAINFLYKLNNDNPIILVGSSYSASLSLILSVNNDKVKAVAAFSPGEYFEGINVKDKIKNLTIPIFITSSKKEIVQVEGLLNKVISNSVRQFKPTKEGIHGSRMLWKTTSGHNECWKSFTSFLDSLK